jgi:glycosyltransferase involved in cell wall biosynthesis
MTQPTLPNDFDWKIYLKNNEDLISAGITTKEQVIKHYLKHGQFENRNIQPILPNDFDWEFYLKNNEDLINANIITKEQAIKHFLKHGIFENRVYKKNIKVYDITISGEIREEDGLGKITKSLGDICSNIDIKYNILETIKSYEKKLKNIEFKNNQNEIGKIHITTNFPFEIPPKEGNLNFIYSMYEATKIHNLWVESINKYYDGVLVPDQWVCDVYKNSGVKKPIYVIPPYINYENLEKTKRNLGNEDKFVFGINAYFEPRKNHKEIIESFLDCFKDNKNVILKVHGKGGLYYDEFKKTYKDNTNIEITTGILSEQDLSLWYESIDCFVLCSSGEGFSLTPRECAIREIPTIITNWSAHSTLVKTDGYLSVECKKLKPAYQKGLFNEYVGFNVDIDTNDISLALLEMYKNYDLYKTKILKAKEWILQNENLDVITKKFLDFYESEKNKKRFGVITTWNTPCGIADYAEFMCENLGDYKILSNKNEHNLDEKKEYNVFRCFNSQETLNELQSVIINENITHLIINYHIVLFSNTELIKLINFLESHKINVVIILHNSTTLDNDAIEALKKINSVFIHTKTEFDHFKTKIDNCKIFNHPIKIFPRKILDTNLPKNKKIISSFGFLLKHKGIVELVKSFVHIQKKDEDTHLLLLNSIHPNENGDKSKSILNEINKIIIENNLIDKVTIKNERLEGDEIQSYLSETNCVVYLYGHTNESSSAAVRTGLASGVPIICSKNKIFDDVSDYVFFVSNDDSEKTADEILQILKNKKELEEKKIKQEKWINENSWENNIKIILENFNGINLCGFINGSFGLGEYSRKIKKSLEKLSINHNTNEIIAKNHHYEKIFETTKINNYNKNLLVFNPNSLNLIPKDFYLNKYNIGVWFWELPHLPTDWIKTSTNYSEIWAPTNFIYDVLKKDLPKNIILKKINFPVLDSIKMDKNDAKKHFGINDDEFLCLFIFDYSSDFYRKNPFAVIETFKKTFNNNKKCKLIIKSQNGSKKQIQDIKDFIGNDNRVIIINEAFTKDKINILLNSSDVYISLHRSEGLGLTIMESILLEKPTLCTNYSGNLDFCLPEWSELVDYKLTQINDESVYKHFTNLDNQQWAEPSVDDAIIKLKKIYENQQEYIEKAKIGRKFILEKYDENVFNEQIKNLK